MALFGALGWLFGSKGALYLGAPVPAAPPLVIYPGEPGPLPASNSACPCCCSCGSAGQVGYKNTKTLTISNVANPGSSCWAGLANSYRFNSLPINGTFTLTLRAQYRYLNHYTTQPVGPVGCIYGLDVPASSDGWGSFNFTCAGAPDGHCTVMHLDLLIVERECYLFVYLTNPAPPFYGQPPIVPGSNPSLQGPIIAEFESPLGSAYIPYLDIGGPLGCGGSITFDSANPPAGLSPNFANYAGNLFGGKYIVTDA